MKKPTFDLVTKEQIEEKKKEIKEIKQTQKKLFDDLTQNIAERVKATISIKENNIDKLASLVSEQLSKNDKILNNKDDIVKIETMVISNKTLLYVIVAMTVVNLLYYIFYK